jgi:hypothetical protein
LATKTSGAITSAGITTLTGTGAEIGTVLASASQFVSLVTANFTSTTAVPVANLNLADSFTTGVITTTVAEGDVATLKTLTDANSNNALTIVVTDTNADAGDLGTINGITSVTVDAQTNVTTITGSAAEIIALLGAAGITILAGVNFVIDEAASAANIQTIAAATTGEVTATLAAGENTLNLSTSTASKNTIILNDDGVAVTGSNQIDVITVGAGADTLNLGLGDDVVNVNSGDGAGDTINTQGGNDNVFINDGAVGASDVITIDTGTNTDIVTVSGTNFFNASPVFAGTPTIKVNSNVTFTADQIAAAGGTIDVAAGGSGEHAIAIVATVGGATSVSLSSLDGITSLTVGAGLEVGLSDAAAVDLAATVTTATAAGFAAVGLNLAATAVASVSAAAKATLTSGAAPAITSAALKYSITDTASNILAEEARSDGYILAATSVTVTDAISISDFNLIDLDDNGNIILAGGISDAAASIAPGGTATAGFTAAVTQDPDVAVTITGTAPTITELNAVAAATAGVVTATISDNVANLVGSLNTASTDAITITVTDSSADAANLNTIDGETSVGIVATSVATITGTAAAIVTAAQSGGITTAASYAATVSSGTASVAQMLIIDADTAGVITASIGEGDLATLKTLTDTNSNNVLTITVTDTTAAAADLTAVDAITSVAVNARAVETITGSVAELNAYRGAFDANTITGRRIYSVETDDTSAVAADLLTLANPGTGAAPDANLASIQSISGSAANVQALYALPSGVGTGVSGLGNEIITLSGAVAATVAQLKDINDATTGTVTLNAATNTANLAGSTADLVAAFNGITTHTGTLTATTAATVDDLNAIAAATAGTVTATVSNTAISDLVGITETGHALTITVATTTVAASDLITVNAATTRAVDATAVTRVNGSVADAKTLITAVNSSDITGLNTAQFSLSDTGSNTTTDILSITTFTSGRVTSVADTYVGSVAHFGNADGSAAASFLGLIATNDLVTNSAFAIEFTAESNVTATAMLGILSSVNDAAQLNLDVTVAAAQVSLFTGSVTDLVAALVTTGAQVSASTSNVTITGAGAASVAQLKGINDATATVTLNTATITANLIGSAADLADAFTGITSHTGTLTVNDGAATSVTASDLVIIGTATAGNVTVTNALAISGSAAELEAALMTTATLVAASTSNVTITGAGAASVAQLKGINDAAATITLNAATIAANLTGAAADLADGFAGITTHTGTLPVTGSVSARGGALNFLIDASSGPVTLNAATIAANLTDAAADLADGDPESDVKAPTVTVSG